jgi:hypothetical protein
LGARRWGARFMTFPPAAGGFVFRVLEAGRATRVPGATAGDTSLFSRVYR